MCYSIQTQTFSPTKHTLRAHSNCWSRCEYATYNMNAISGTIFTTSVSTHQSL